MKKKLLTAVAVFIIAIGCVPFILGSCTYYEEFEETYSNLSDIPQFCGKAYVTLNDNVPEFTEEELDCDVFESYSELDDLGRCGPAYALICRELMPTEKRGSIGQIKPSGWHTVRYDDLISDKYLYNRCHLIGYQLAGENANEKNLITGTRYMNVEGMLPFEDEVADYVRETNNHVLYRVSPIFEGNDLVARGVQMEAFSVEDSGEGVCFNVFVYNVQPGIIIDYATGDSRRADYEQTQNENTSYYVLNTASLKFHHADCSGAAKIAEKNREEFTGTREELIEEGFSPCGICNP